MVIPAAMPDQNSEPSGRQKFVLALLADHLVDDRGAWGGKFLDILSFGVRQALLLVIGHGDGCGGEWGAELQRSVRQSAALRHTQNLSSDGKT